jgi:hypothetical protein
MILPTPAAAVLLPLAPAFTAPAFERFVLLAVAALLATGRRTVANLLRTLGALAPGHRTSYQRVLSCARWSGLALARRFGRLVLRWVPVDRPALLVGDDTVDGHKDTHPVKVNLLADPERQGAQFTGSRSSPQGARLFSTRFAFLPASRAIHASAPGVIFGGVFLAPLLEFTFSPPLLFHVPFERKGIHVRRSRNSPVLPP